MTRATRGSAGATRERLIRAALRAFGRGGFQGTDSNRIARAAGFAPQTFYRWFDAGGPSSSETHSFSSQSPTIGPPVQ